jgi:adenylosuccinate lyase
LKKGLEKLIINEDKIKQDLDDNWAVVSEALQTVLRREKYPQPYEALKELTRTNEKITSESISKFIDGLDVTDEIKQALPNIKPVNVTGVQLI